MGFMNGIGIPDVDLNYHKILESQNIFIESMKTHRFIENLINKKLLPLLENVSNDQISIQFINYGDTELVYVLKIGYEMFTLLIGQPSLNYGFVKQEYENLISLSNKNSDVVVRPIHYVCDEFREAYITPYLMQARCIASQNNGWGIYIPEPTYHFKLFNRETLQCQIVNSCIISLLIKMYDENNNLGLSQCKIGGGDFILEREWSEEPLSFHNTVKRIKLIAARDFINVPLEQYIELIKTEFLKTTYYSNYDQRDKSILINAKSRIPMTKEEIQIGIELGIEMRKKDIKK